ncbi:MAG: 6-phospho-3-hexuloisomerase [Methanomicrobium sp.]|uniref:6-phospho-3-hexuloisomerase n=1 Tax=Methanomicrobium mobile TaxID=2205 RepID=UPI0005B2C528|nr:6-phospho-3-hexuloisomerase [Methanomicrobium mobile]MBP5083326.1 6-phospho-3-hexuloisomerase [Methanomicrobium sp.]MBQ3719126.1 6-phospho-3-hexuloisomerase [Methanomicrobium sp.]MBQ4414556.1 6-phospho-3-hexuloisomerase [Methanomicrobium sp.]
MYECKTVQDMICLMSSKIKEMGESLSDQQVSSFINEILGADRIYVMGAGRSGLVAKAFAMRLMHLGLKSYVIGETITPAMRSSGDIVVAFSGSGETKTIAELCETAKSIGGRICLVTSKAESRIGKIADCVVVIESHRDRVKDESEEYEVRQMMGEHKSFAPLGTLFETASMVFSDSIISAIMEKIECQESDLKGRHANIE